MNTKTMEGLVGARTNINMVNTPMRVYKEARRKGDTATMERAMGYVNEFEDEAVQYKTKVDAGMKEEAKKAREKAELEREKAIKKRREEREKLEERIEEKREAKQDKVEISEEGRALLEQNTNLDNADLDHPVSGKTSAETKTEAADVGKETVTYFFPQP